MDEFVAKANIEHYKRLLQTETDPEKRALLTSLLKVEMEKAEAAAKLKRPSKSA